MIFSLWKGYGAKGSLPVFDSFEQGASRHGHTCVYHDESADAHVIWSVLERGKMSLNSRLWNLGKPVIVLETSTVPLSNTWRVGLNGLTKDHIVMFPDQIKRENFLFPKMSEWKYNQQGFILICTQNTKSKLWHGMPEPREWVRELITNIRKFTDRKIVVRSHPRSPFPVYEHNYENVTRQVPANKQDFSDSLLDAIDNAWCVINHNSSPSVISVINGVPVFCDKTSLSSAVSNYDLRCVESLKYPDRSQWFEWLMRTEWTLQEISSGLIFEKFYDIMM